MTMICDMLTRGDNQRLFPMSPYRLLGLLFVVTMLSGAIYNNGAVALNQEGYCEYRVSVNESYQTMAMFPESIKTTRDCGLFGWASCTIYRQVYRSRLDIRYRIRYKLKQRCCEGWEEVEIPPVEILPIDMHADIRCTKIPVPTTDAPANATVATIPTPELPVNYSIITTKQSDAGVAIIGAVDTTTEPGIIPGGPVPDPGGGGLFTGEDMMKNMIGLIGIVAGLILIILLVVCIALCCRKRKRKEERKLSDPSALELLNRGVVSTSNGRVGESTYAEIPESQTQRNPPNDTTTRDNNCGVDEAQEAPIPGNQYHEIFDLMQTEQNGDLPPPPCMDSHLPVESENYAYAYIDNKNLPKGDRTETPTANGNVELKENTPNAKYAEVRKNKDLQKSPGSDEQMNPEGEMMPKTIQAYITHIPTGDCDAVDMDKMDNLQECNLNDNPEIYSEVKIGTGTPDNFEYDLVQVPGPNNEANTEEITGFEVYDEVGQTPSASQVNPGRDKLKTQNSVDLCKELSPESGYGTVYGDAVDNIAEDNHYSTLEGQKYRNENDENNLQRPPTYDRLERQISTTSMPHGSPTNSRKTLQKKSPNYSKLDRSTRQDASATLPAGHTGYGIVGNKGHHGTMPQQVYDTINTDPLSPKVPVQQDIYEVNLSNDNHVLQRSNSEQIPEGSYATIPSGEAHPNQTYDKLQRAENDVVNQNQVTDLNNDNSNGQSGLNSDIPAPDSSLYRQDTVYENAPKGNRRNDRKANPPSSATYDIPSSRSSLVDDVDNPRVPPNSTYDIPSRNSTSPENESRVNSTYDSPNQRNHNKHNRYNGGARDSDHSRTRSNSSYDTPTKRDSIEQDILYENAAKRRNTVNSVPMQYEHMGKGDRISNVSTGSYYEDMHKGNRNSSRLGNSKRSSSLDASVPSPFTPTNIQRQDTLYENTARDKKE